MALTPAEAQRLQDAARARGQWLMWFVAVTQGDISQTVSATATVASSSTASANFVTSGTVTEIDVHVGDLVTKGQLLAKVDPTAAQSALDTALTSSARRAKSAERMLGAINGRKVDTWSA